MKWLQFDAYYLESADGRYTVDRARIDKDGHYRYTAWQRGKPPLNLGCCDTAALAKDLCEVHERGEGQLLTEQHENGDGI